MAGDIGATKTNLGLFLKASDHLTQKAFVTFPSCARVELVERTRAFLKREGVLGQVPSACFGVAGPLCRGRVVATNLGLELDESGLCAELKIAVVRLVNDLYATAVALAWLPADQFAVLQAGGPGAEEAVSAVLAPGTGLGMAFLVAAGPALPLIVASEGGHVDFAPRDEAEIELWRYLRARYGRVSREHLLSGPGLLNIYQWCRETSNPAVISPVAATAAAAVVSSAEHGDPAARQALTLFVSLLGAAAGDLALTGLAGGGVYLAGGIPAKIINSLRQDGFLRAFQAKGRMAAWLSRVPVRVVLDEQAALLGAARLAALGGKAA